MIVPVMCLSACATVSKDYQEYLDSKAVDVRVAERWSALLGRDHVKAYAYLTPNYREMTSQEDHMKSVNTRIIWEDFEVIRTRCEEQICKVSVQSKYRLPPMFGFPRGVKSSELVKETWLYDNGNWYYLPPKGK